MTRISRVCGRGVRVALAGAVAAVLIGTATPVAAQDSPVTVTGGVDFPSLYYFRGWRQETEPKLTMQPFIDVGGALFSGDGGLKSANLNVGSWNSIHSGSNNDDYDGAFYESDFYATLTLGFEKASLAATYTAYTYPAPDIDAIHEIALKVSSPTKLAPYGLVAFEFAEEDPGTYVELGIAPTFPLSDAEGAPTVTIPARVAFDAKDYYGGDTGFAYFGVGATFVIPRGKWSIKAAADLLMLSETLEGFNFNGDDFNSVGFLGLIGLGFSF